MKFTIKSLGCKVNQYDGEKLARDLMRFGLRPSDTNGDDAGIMIVNTCAVTQTAEHKDRQMIRRFKKQNPNARVIVTGCYSQIAEETLINLPEVDYIVKNVEKESFAQKVYDEVLTHDEKVALSSLELTHDAPELYAFLPSRRHRATVKVQEGCNRFCSFCIIPFTRPVLSSRAIDEVLQEVEVLAQLGYKEIVLTGVILGAYGKEEGSISRLPELLRRISVVSGIKRIRLSSLDPRDISDELIEVVSELPKLCPHFHISLQSGDDGVLEKMNRGYTSYDFLKICDKVYSMIPDAAITTDIIAGFHGEDERALLRTKEVMLEAKFSRCHVFKYSMRQGTKAGAYGDTIPEPEKERRVRELISHALTLQQNYHQKFIGRTMDVLVEEKNKQGMMGGLTSNYMRVYCNGEEHLSGKIVPVALLKFENDALYGEVLTH